MDAERLKELFEPFGPVAVKKMFGGYGIYAGEVVFALATGDEVFLKVDALTEPEFIAAGSTPFVYEGHSRPVKMSFYRLLASAYDEADELKRWSEKAVGAARRAAQAKAIKANAAKPKPSKVKIPNRARAKAKSSRSNRKRGET
jgi:DNA transformation protein and related proteins